MRAKISTADRSVIVTAWRTLRRRPGCGLDVSRFWCRALVPIALLCGLASASAWADKASVTTFFQPNGSKSLSVSGLTAGASYTVCLGLITGGRQCDFAQ